MPDLDRGHLLTEQRNTRSSGIDRMTVSEAFDVMNLEDRRIAEAVADAKPQICAAIEMVVDALQRGGRLFYVGAGTSGRLGVMDAAECPPTFMTPPHLVQGLIAGGREAMWRSIEGAEDRAEDARRAVAECAVGAYDVVMGIATGGTTPFVHTALQEAATRGAGTVFLACVPAGEQDDQAQVSIRVLTGPEVLSGSTRLKGGTATKMVLNMITTIAMIRLGKVFSNLMVDLNRQACVKLRDRALRIVAQATGLPRADAETLLHEAGDVKSAIVMHFKQVDRARAQALLQEHGGRLRDILEPAGG